MNFYRKHWFDVGGVLAVIISISLLVLRSKLSPLQKLLALNFVALLAHQFEEYRFPGFFPGHFNGGFFNSETPDRYPLNTNSALIINTALGYPFYVIPVFFPTKGWLGLAGALFGFSQALAHGLVFPRLAKTRYSPGVLTALLLHVPVGALYVRRLRHDQPLQRADWLKAVTCEIIMAVGGIAGPTLLLKDKQSPYRFARRQLGSWGADAKAPRE